MMMKTGLFAAAALLGAALAPAAQAAISIDFTPAAADGSFSGTLSNTGVGNPSFNDLFNFYLPTGIVNGTITSTATSAFNNIDFTSIFFNGVAFTPVSTGKYEIWELADTVVTAGNQTLTVAGTAGSSASYVGTGSFSPSAVPEPGTWAMMIIGFGAIGVAMRRRRSPDGLAMA
jgi:hypothetical protein